MHRRRFLTAATAAFAAFRPDSTARKSLLTFGTSATHNKDERPLSRGQSPVEVIPGALIAQ